MAANFDTRRLELAGLRRPAAAPAQDQQRAQWTESETYALIRIWEDSLCDLRRTKRNAKVYATIEERLRALGVDKCVKSIRSKIENLGNKYRSLRRKKAAGVCGIQWKFYRDLHRFLGSPPVNDATLAEEVSCNDSTSVERVGAHLNVLSHDVKNESPSSDNESENPTSEQELLGISQSPGSSRSSGSPSTSQASAVEGSESASESRCEAVCQYRPSTAATNKTIKQPARDTILVQLVEELRQLRYVLENSVGKKLELRERQVLLQERAEQREEKLIAVLERLCNK